MTQDALLDALQDYEASHAVENYMVDGWHVWPFLKMALRLGWLPREARPSWRSRLQYLFKATWPGRVALGLSRLPGRLRRSAESRAPAAAGPVDALLLTLAERRVSREGKSYEIYTDPFVAALTDLGLSCRVWEQGCAGVAQHFPSTRVDLALNREAGQRGLFSPVPGAPHWFAEMQGLLLTCVGRTVPWHELYWLLESCLQRSRVFEGWLRRLAPRVLFVVCWYDPIVMAAVMAARRCGIRTVEIQHGLQGRRHAGYSGWLRSPAGGYEVLPDVFWCWGNDAAAELRQFNPGFPAELRVLAGGNLWLNEWKKQLPQRRQARQAAGAGRRLLVTLQREVPPLLLDLLKGSPAMWTWVIRFHPSRQPAERQADQALLLATGHPGIVFDDGQLLYAQLLECDCHLTEASSVALEAMFFEVPTLILADSILGKLGAISYEKYIAQGFMHCINNPLDGLYYLRDMSFLKSKAEVFGGYFSSDCNTSDLLLGIFDQK